MSLLSRMRKQYAVYWAPGGIGPDGATTFEEPVELRVRWEDSQEQFVNREGDVKVSKSKVYTENNLEISGYLWKGNLEDLTDPSDPLGNEDAYEIQSVSEIPDMKAKRFLRIAWL